MNKRTVDDGSLSMVRGPWITVQGPWITVQDPLEFARHGSRENRRCSSSTETDTTYP